jgi:hypothetical protein
LGITIGTYGADPEQIPRTRLVTVPYSFRTATVDGASGGTIAGDIHTTGKVGIGTTSPAAELHVNGSIYTLGGSGDADLNGVINVSDLDTMVQYFTLDAELSEASYAEADMDGDGKVTWEDVTILQRILFETETKEQAVRKVYSLYGPLDGGNTFYIGGNLGIGTTNPQGALDVTSTTGALIGPRMTTSQRDALSPVNGMIIYNTTTNQFNFYENGSWVTKQSAPAK